MGIVWFLITMVFYIFLMATEVNEEFPQKLDNANGKIHRLHDDGKIPADNPFVNTTDAIGSIYSYGHRNPEVVLHQKRVKFGNMNMVRKAW